MSTHLNPYLSFRGNAREAMEFYHSVFGGDLVLNRYDSIPGVMGDGDEGAKIMHGQLDTPDGLTLMGADMPDSMADTPDVTVGGGSGSTFSSRARCLNCARKPSQKFSWIPEVNRRDCQYDPARVAHRLMPGVVFTRLFGTTRKVVFTLVLDRDLQLRVAKVCMKHSAVNGHLAAGLGLGQPGLHNQ